MWDHFFDIRQRTLSWRHDTPTTEEEFERVNSRRAGVGFFGKSESSTSPTARRLLSPYNVPPSPPPSPPTPPPPPPGARGSVAHGTTYSGSLDTFDVGQSASLLTQALESTTHPVLQTVDFVDKRIYNNSAFSTWNRLVSADGAALILFF